MNIPFLTGIWAQPASSVAKWAARGINTFYGYDGGGNVAKADWEKAVAAGGLGFISAPGTDLVAEAAQPGRVGWCQPDEPDLVTHLTTPGSTIGDLQATYKRCKAAAPTIPVFQNLSGSCFDNVAYDGTPHPTKTDASKIGHRAATGGYMAWCDVIGFDYHLDTTGRKGMFDITQRLMDRCFQWSGGKPQFVYAEACSQGSGNAYSADDMQAETDNITSYAAKMGYPLRGIIWFADQVIPTWKSYDMMTPDLVARMVTINAKLAPPVVIPPPPAPVTRAEFDALVARTARVEAALGGAGTAWAGAFPAPTLAAPKV